MAVAFDVAGGAGSAGGGTSTLNASVTVGSLTNGIGLVASWGSNSGATSVTWGGTGMTLIENYVTTSFLDFKLYGILNPSSGSTTITSNYGGNQNKIVLSVATYQGVNQSLTLSKADIAEDTTTSYAMAGTAVGTGVWGVAFTIANISTTAPTAGTSTTKRTAQRASADSVWVSIMDSNAIVSGAFTLNQTNSVSGQIDAILVSLSTPTVPAVGGTLALMGCC